MFFMFLRLLLSLSLVSDSFACVDELGFCYYTPSSFFVFK